MLGEGTKMGDKSSVKRSVIGRHCRIGSNVKVWCFLFVYLCVCAPAHTGYENCILKSHLFLII